ncbi:MAG: hypothetical protein EOP39_30190, partial [Rubrivivax sp.]
MKLPLLFALCVAGAVQAQTYTVVCAKAACGRLLVTETAARLETDHSYRNNGRGPDQKEVLEFAPDGAWTAYRTEGVSTYGARIDETFELKDGRASWRSPVDRGEKAGVGRELVYLPVQASPAWAGRLAQTLLKRPHQRAAALPVGQLSIER